MTITEILHAQYHRPWPMPVKKWTYYQEWNDAVFLHWQVNLADLQKHVPRQVEIDLYAGKAWVSVVAFSMENIRPRGLPPFSPVSDFYEVNVRTYVKANNKTGVYFLSIEGGKWLSCKIAKAMSGLPYSFSEMKRKQGYFLAENAGKKSKLEIEFSAGKEIDEKPDLDKWLTERYALFQDTLSGIIEYEIHHLEWPIRELKLHKLAVNYPEFNHLISASPDLVQYSKGVQVLAWGSKKIKAG